MKPQLLIRVGLSVVSLCLAVLVLASAEDAGQSGPAGSVAAQTEPKTVVVWDEAATQADRPWQPSGWMPDGGGISMRTECTDKPQSGETCIEVGAGLTDHDWVGVYFLAGGKWGETRGPNLYSPLGIRKGDPAHLSFWARGRDGGERVEFKVGGMTSGQYPDSIRIPITSGYKTLTREWSQITIDLTGKPLGQVSGPLCWVTNKNSNPKRKEVWFYLDSIQFVAGPIPSKEK